MTIDEMRQMREDAEEGLLAGIHSIQGTIDELEGERDAYVKELRQALQDAQYVVDEADGDEDWYDEAEDIVRDLENMLDEVE